MAKKKVKKTSKSDNVPIHPKKDKRKSKKPSIKVIVLNALAENPDITCEELGKLVRAVHPDSAFKKTHLAWYKYMIRKGKLKLPGGVQLPPARKSGKKKGAIKERAASKKKKTTKKKAKKTRKVVEEVEDEEEEE